MCHGPREHRDCGCAPQARHEHTPHHHYWSGEEFAGGFGVRRPLRFLAWKLGLSEPQLERFAALISELKTERAQAAVDGRRSLSEFADAVSGDAFEATKAQAAGDRRVQSAERLRAAVLKALQEIHSLLNADQRTRFAYLIRTGALAM